MEINKSAKKHDFEDLWKSCVSAKTRVFECVKSRKKN